MAEDILIVGLRSQDCGTFLESASLDSDGECCERSNECGRELHFDGCFRSFI